MPGTTETTTPYATALPYLAGGAPSWVPTDYDGQRLESYDLYDDMFDNSPSTYNFMLRGSDEKPIYIPTAKRICNTIARYIGRNWGYKILTGEVDAEGNEIEVDASDNKAALDMLAALFKRERVLAQFSSGKRDFVKRGDWIWMIYADDSKKEGRKVSIKTIDPRTYFPIQDDDEDLDHVTGCEIIEEFVMDDDEPLALKVQRWLKPSAKDYDEAWGEEIGYGVFIYEVEGYGTKDEKIMQTPTPMDAIPGITSLPLYHIKNNEQGSNPFGKSDLAGLESIVAGINQSTSDEDLALAMQGLGMFVTDSSRPVDPETGQPTNWILGPEVVVEVADGKKFEKIQGITTVTPMQDHIGYMAAEAYAVHGLSDVAMGTASATESGIALAIRLAPLFDAADEKDLLINETMDQLLFDLTNEWLPVYEGVSFEGVVIQSYVDRDSRLPFDRDTEFNELMVLYTDGIADIGYVIRRLNEKFGYDFDEKDIQAAVDAKAAQDEAAQEAAVTARTAAELADGTTGTTDDGTTDA